MKRILSLILALLMLTLTVACNDTTTPGETTPAETTPAPTTPATPDEPDDTQLYAGYSRVSITPPNKDGILIKPIEIAQGQFVHSVANDICATTIAVSDATTTILLITLDLRDMRIELYLRVAEAISKATGLPIEQMSISTTHNHSAPELSINWQTLEDRETMDEYEELLIEKVTQSAVEAMDELFPTTMHIAKGKTDKLSFVRRYLLKDGTYTSNVRREGEDYWGKDPLNWATDPVAYETEIDEELQTLKFDRDGAKDIVMVNWQCHPAAKQPRDTINSDWVHYMRKGVEEDNDVLFAFFQGGMGNVNNNSFLGDAKYSGDTLTLRVGNELAQVIAGTLENMEEIPSAPIRFDYNLLRHPIEAYSKKIRIFTTVIGDFALTTSPFEMFCQIGKYVKDNAPTKMTFFLSVTNGYLSYLPPEDIYSHGGYEVRCSGFKNDPALADNIAKRMVNTIKTLSK